MIDITKLRPLGEYAKTDIALYSELTNGKIKTALTTQDPETLDNIFRLISIKDSKLSSEINRRYSGIRGKSFTHKLDKRYNTIIRELITASQKATIFGYAVVELYLDSDLNYSARFVDYEYLYYRDKKLYTKTKNIEIEIKEPRFWIIKRKPLLLNLLWIIYAKHFVLSHYMKFTEFLGVPPLIVNASSSDGETITAIADAVKRLKSATYGVFGPADTVKVLEGRGSQKDFMEFVKYVDNEIAVAISGSVLTSGTSGTGSYAMSSTHENSRYEIIESDCITAVDDINYIFSLFGLDCDLQILFERDKNLLERAQTMQIVASLGYSTTPEELAKEFDLPPPTKQKTISKNSKTKELEIDKFDSYQNSNSFKKDLKAIEKEIETRLDTLINSCNSYEEAFDKLMSSYPDFDIELLETVMFRAVANSDIFGKIDE